MDREFHARTKRKGRSELITNILALIGITIFALVALLGVLIGTVLYFKEDRKDNKNEENSEISQGKF